MGANSRSTLLTLVLLAVSLCMAFDLSSASRDNFQYYSSIKKPAEGDDQVVASTTFNYAEALEKSILFYEAQRSGKLPSNQRLTYRGDSALSDGSSDNVDLVGGYYDAGDNIKFGFPMAFTTTMLSWSVIEFGSLMPKEIHNARAAVRWGADYLLKAATAKADTLYVQVGEPNADHRCWERPEDMDTPRPVYKVTKQNPGSDVAAETAAALAAASIVFRVSDPSYSAKLLQVATQVFEFADTYRGAYSDSLNSVVCPFYCSYSGYKDELLWGASWLHLATHNASYLSYIISNGHSMEPGVGDGVLSWDDKAIGTKILLAQGFLHGKINELQPFKEYSDNYICYLIPGTPNFQAQYTPGGLLFKRGWSNLQYVSTTSFLLLTYAKYINANGGKISCGTKTVTSADLVSMAKKQVDYILGENPGNMSYMVGFGSKYPQHVHHRGSSVPSVRSHPDPISCNSGFQYLYTSSPNPNILEGALVGGPDSNDNYADERNRYEQSEPATYINAPFVGALAFFAAGH
ncbi:hypothetical protein H6P81_015589 [Aristolochia fimbriata]|uniref:Endoglucanase n=2 Tax=Aristolochia fimbriata TaxID=158543 RepID=A0AAV7E7T5_ARIFI|nr:hypothetical protein H6P81_015589 [Aristolochia fimbriata]